MLANDTKAVGVASGPFTPLPVPPGIAHDKAHSPRKYNGPNTSPVRARILLHVIIQCSISTTWLISHRIPCLFLALRNVSSSISNSRLQVITVCAFKIQNAADFESSSTANGSTGRPFNCRWRAERRNRPLSGWNRSTTKGGSRCRIVHDRL